MYYSIASGSSLGQIELDFLDFNPSSKLKLPSKSSSIYAIRCDNIMNEVSMLNFLTDLNLNMSPLISTILAPPSNNKLSNFVSPFKKMPELMDLVLVDLNILTKEINKIKSEFNLNDDQMDLINTCALWFNPNLKTKSNSLNTQIVLVHGVFGSGKSHLAVSLIIFLNRLLKICKNNDVRILIAANTNVAVDRILLGLQKYGFEDFARVGSVKKIAKPLLKNVINCSEGKSSSNDTITNVFKSFALKNII